MLAGLLRLSYAFQLGLGAFLGNLLLPIEQTIPRLLLGAAILPLLFQATLTFLSLGLATSSRYTDSSRWPTGLLRFVRVWRAEWYAALTIFAIRQPGRAHSPGIVFPAEPVAGGGENVPVVLVHGYICNHRVWDDVIPALRRGGHAVLALDLEPLFTGIDNYVGQVEAAVQSLRAFTGRDQVALVGHSMGGLVIRAWMRAYGTEHVKRVVTLGSPHQGTQLAVLSGTPNGSQMRWKSEWLAHLAEQETPETRSLIQIALSDSDNIVFPQNDQTLEGSAVTVFSDLGHLELCIAPDVVQWLCRQLDDPSQMAGRADANEVAAASGTQRVPLENGQPGRPADLFWAFSWIALQGFGGVLAVLQRELVDRKRWLTQNQFVEDWSVSQILPGPNVVNLALMMGDRYFGWRGSIAALSGIVIFPMLLVLALAVFFSGVADVPEVQAALRGMGAVAAGMIAGQGLRLLASLHGNVLGRYWAYAVALATFIASALLGLPLVWILAIVGATACVAAFRLLGRQPHDRSP